MLVFGVLFLQVVAEKVFVVVTGKVFLFLDEIEMVPCIVFPPLLIGLYCPSFSGCVHFSGLLSFLFSFLFVGVGIFFPVL